MGWFRVDDEFLTNPKVMALSSNAKVLYISGLAYCSTNLTDGHIPAVALGLVAAAANVPTKTSADLVTAGLWHKAADGWDVHDYLEHQDPSERIRARRVANRERAQSWREKRRTYAARNGVTSAVSHASDSTAQHIDQSGFRELPGADPPAEPRSNEHTPEPHPDQTVLDHIATTIGWTSTPKRAQLAATWDWGLRLLDCRALEDTLLRCTNAGNIGYLQAAITRTAKDAGVELPNQP